MNQVTWNRIVLVVIALGFLATLPICWGIASQALKGTTGPQPLVWPFIIMPFVGIGYALHMWSKPLTAKTKH